MRQQSRLQQLFSEKKEDILNIYFTAGFPKLEDTARIIQALDDSGVDLIEIGMPYSDPMADGPTIQASGAQALQNGMKLSVLFDQLKTIRAHSNVPLILMGYFNQVMQYGEERFFAACQAVGIDGLILPDLPIEVFAREYQALYRKYALDSIFLISPQSAEERIRRVDELSSGFIYMVADASITGKAGGISEKQVAYFKRIESLHLKTPRLIGFGIADHTAYATVNQYADGAIVGSAFIRHLEQDATAESIAQFIQQLKGIPSHTTKK